MEIQGSSSVEKTPEQVFLEFKRFVEKKCKNTVVEKYEGGGWISDGLKWFMFQYLESFYPEKLREVRQSIFSDAINSVVKEVVQSEHNMLIRVGKLKESGSNITNVRVQLLHLQVGEKTPPIVLVALKDIHLFCGAINDEIVNSLATLATISSEFVSANVAWIEGDKGVNIVGLEHLGFIPVPIGRQDIFSPKDGTSLFLKKSPLCLGQADHVSEQIVELGEKLRLTASV